MPGAPGFGVFGHRGLGFRGFGVDIFEDLRGERGGRSWGFKVEGFPKP